jgi:hypothetical protein
LKVPALAIYAFDDPARAAPPWYDAHDATLAATLAEIAQLRDAARRANLERFRREVEHGEVVEMHDATHYLIQSNQQQVLEAIETFASR